LSGSAATRSVSGRFSGDDPVQKLFETAVARGIKEGSSEAMQYKGRFLPNGSA
jgi:hypothetical protein